MTRSLIVVAALAALFASPVSAQDKVTKATNWKAQAEHGGYYQAVATGIYAKYGLDVTIRQGGPNVDNNLLMLAGRIDFSSDPPPLWDGKAGERIAAEIAARFGS